MCETYYAEDGGSVALGRHGAGHHRARAVGRGDQAARLAAIVESSDDAVVGKDLLGTIVSWNSGAERLYGYTEAEALGRPVSMLALGGHQDEVPKILERIRVGERVEHFETTRVAKDGREIDVSLAISPIKSAGGSIIGAASVARDITKQKLAERALRHVEAALMAEKDELARSNAELEQFAYVASHDLQEPLRMVASYTQLLSRRYKGKLDDDADEFIGYAVDGAQRMQQLITDLLAFSRVGTRGKPLVAMESQSACDEALANLAVTIEESGAQVDADPLPTVKGDHQQLVQLFQNLIGNAIKFHGEEPARVHVSALKDGREWVFSVADDGIGIGPAVLRAHLRHLPAPPGSPGVPGHGHRSCALQEDRRSPPRADLGRVPTRPGLYLLLHDPDSRRCAMMAAVTTPIEILMVEDSPGDVRLTKEALKDAKVLNHISVVEDGVAAMAFLRREGAHAEAPRPDLILLDLNLPRKDGREVLAEIKADPALTQIPVVVLTTSQAEQDILKSYQLHANCYVTKPVDLDKFISVVKSVETFWLTVARLPSIEPGG